ncbi:MAG TPA: phytoene desaturase family protein [Ignavibacteriaceae bacterium]|nr:phytoene desaturase family protein [Ignavibacteriaceae bacterium]HRP92085.1 phytoene desaturase family protein [Ignavibacteriaceae bacterium]HRQ54573.1 phytoene desaturase family protein [Ignavibacteriaceae bacterium]
MSLRISIVGAGLGGLSAAISLANKGFEVDLYEQNSKVGGKAGEINESGFRFDSGPSLLTMPFVIKELFDECDEDINDYIKLTKLDIICKYFYTDKTIINAYSDVKKFGEELEQKTIDNSDSLNKYLEYCKTIYELTGDLFLTKDPSSISTYLNSKALKTFFNIHKIDPFRTINEANSSFFKDKRLVQLFNRYATYNGSNPYLAPATLNIIPHVEYNQGSFIPNGGIYSISKALRKLAEKKGVNIFLNQKVEEIVLNDNEAKGIKVNNVIRYYDKIISNADVNYTFKILIKNFNSKEASRFTKKDPSFSGLVFYWGINKEFRELETHNILFAKNYKREFDDLFINKTIHSDPTIYIYISSKLNNEDAPKGKENWFVMVNAPHIQNQNWEDEIKNARTNIINKINSFLNTNIEQFIEFEKVMSPVDIQNKTGSYRGSIYGISSNDKFAAFMRQSNKSKTVKNLYFCGGSAHPGGGIPLVILSGKIVSDIIKKEYHK